MAGDFDALFTFAGARPAAPSHRPTILLVSHDASRTGAPYALLHLAKELQRLDRFEIRILTQSAGPLGSDFASAAPLCHGADYGNHFGIGSADFANLVANRFASLQPRGLAICNSIALPEYNEAFMLAGVDVLTWIHELPAFFDASRMELVVRSSKYVSVYSEWNRTRFTGRYEIPDDKLVFIPPTLPYLSQAPTTLEERRAARDAVGLPQDALMVLGVGYLHLIKGIDLFVQVADRCCRMLAPKDASRLVFCWIGGDSDSVTRRVISSDVAALGLPRWCPCRASSPTRGPGTGRRTCLLAHPDGKRWA